MYVKKKDVFMLHFCLLKNKWKLATFYFIDKIIDTQSFDRGTIESINKNENYYEISASMYANPGNKGAAVNQLDVVVLSALEINTNFNVNVMTGYDGLIRGA